MANQFLVKETMAAMRGLSATEITALQNGTYDGVELLGYYQKGDTPAPIVYYLVPTTPDPGPDDGGSVIHASSIKLQHQFVGHFDAVYFGMSQSKSFSENKTITQRVINYAATNKLKSVNFPKWFILVYSDYIIPRDISINSYGSTLEEKKYLNNININGTPVNEVCSVAPYHMGMILETSDVNGVPLENHNARMKSIVMRHNGRSEFQESYTFAGRRTHLYNYKGIANILITSGSVSGGNLIIRLNGIDYNISVPPDSSKQQIQELIRSQNYDSYFTHATILGDTVQIFPRTNTVHIVRNKLSVDGNYNLFLEGQQYQIPVLATDTCYQIATKLWQAPVFSDKYHVYREGVAVTFINKLPSGYISTTLNIISNNTDANLSTSVIGYQNQYNGIVLTKDGSAPARTGFGMWAARNHTVEVADSFAIIADSDNNETNGMSATLTLQNERSGFSKRIRVLQNGDGAVTGTNTSQILQLWKDSGWVETRFSEVERLKFIGTTRDIRSSKLNNEDALYVTNNLGTDFIVRISDSGGIELKQGGSWLPVKPILSGSSANRPLSAITGQEYFDTTLERPIWRKGTVWIDATGSEV